MPELSRRQFLTMMAVSAAGAVAYSGCTPFPSRSEFLTESPGRIPEDTVAGGDNWYATVCRECPGGCGAIVRVYQGRALKVEGNPDHPVNRGALCARGQAAVQALYHPDRFRGPLRRSGDRGGGKLEPISWEDARAELLERLRTVARPDQRGVLLITEPLSGQRAGIVQSFATALNAQYLPFQALPPAAIGEATRRVFGQERLPFFDIARTKYLLSFGADFLGTWLSPVQYSRAYGEFRQGGRDRGHFTQVEPYLSQTGTNADEWVPIRPGTEGVLAMSIAQVLVSSGAADPAAASALLGSGGAGVLDAYSPERAAEITGVAAERTRAIARAFAAQRPALAIGGDQAAAHTNGLFNLTAIYSLNLLAGNVGKEGGVLANPPAPVAGSTPATFGAPLAVWQKLVAAMRFGQDRGSFGLALIHGANPVYGLPRSLGFAEALRDVPYIVSFASVPDETSALADLILPDHMPLEAWGDEVPNPAPGVAVIGTQQPVVNPLHDTRDYLDVLLSLVPDLGGSLQRALPWTSFRDALRAGVQQLQAAVGGTRPIGFEEYWNSVLQKGGWWGDRPSAVSPTTAAMPAIPAQPALPTFAGSAQDYQFHLMVFPHIALGAGEAAHLPWLQSTPDPMTSAAWRTWVQVNPQAAKQLGLSRGDIVTVESTEGSVEAAVYPYPAIAPDVVAMPLGQGHTAQGRWANERGANPFSILAPLTDGASGGFAWAATRVRLRRTGKRVDIPVYEGDVPAVQPEPGLVVKVVKE